MVKSEEQQKSRIVVGVDGSPSSQDALRWAIDQARLTGAAVDAIAALENPVTYGWSFPMPEGDIGSAMGKELSDSVRDALEEGGTPVEICEQAVVGNAAQVLLEAASGADLLVLGSRGHGGFAAALLGSVGQHCVQHASCPVVIVRHDKK